MAVAVIVVIVAALAAGGGSRWLGHDSQVDTFDRGRIATLLASYTACPGQLAINSHTDPDGLPAASSRTDSLGLARRVLSKDEALIRGRYPGVDRIIIGPAGGFVWTVDAMVLRWSYRSRTLALMC
jgi:hypothetical protein